MSIKAADVTTIYSQNPNLRPKDVQAILEWLKTQPHLPTLSELQVILFLHNCFYDLEHAKRNIENYFTLKAKSNLLYSTDEETLRRILISFFIGVLPKKTPEGYSIFLFKTFDPRIEKFHLLEIIRVFFMVATLHFHQNGPSNGIVLVGDAEGLRYEHLFKIKISLIKQCLCILDEIAPSKLKGFHNVNVVPVTKYLIALLKPIVKKEIYDVLRVHPHFDTFYEYVPKKCLPQEYGGELECLSHLSEKNLHNLLENLDYFSWVDNQILDKSKRNKKKMARNNTS